MALTQTTWPQIARELSELLDSSKLSYKRLSDQTGVDYFAVRRLKLGGVKRRTANAIALCKYFGINANRVEETPGHLDEIVAEIKATWDGSDAHARLLIDLVRTTRRFKVSSNPQATIIQAGTSHSTRSRRSKK